ncbi:MAG TPA: hypothetical protein VLF18_13590 [Tahibacter sp.]|uniref:hypothetical protein n=1 Tax=Tahibacter sp. TaxID=2056211 RepID=UPI002C0ED687|nr:hypothetical protein [Tahibacter sp.]HSX61227.1 hypothetical protein [Tahibacter sp.]
METTIVTQALSYVMPLLVLAALAVLLAKTGSPWLIAALAFEALSLLCRIALNFGASELLRSALFMNVWQLFGLLFAVCLLGFAVTWPSHTPARKASS